MELDLDAKGLCKIIETCRANGVSLQLGDLIISLDSTPPRHKIEVDVQPRTGVIDLTKFEPAQPQVETEIATQGQEQLAARLGQEYLDQLILEDPEKYEELIANGEIGHGTESE